MQMEAKRPTVAAPPAAGFDMVAALKDAGFAALVTFGLSIPILAFSTHEDMSNNLDRRAALVVGDLGGRRGVRGAAARHLAIARRVGRVRQAARPQELRKPSRAETFLKTYLTLFVVAALFAFPLAMLGPARPAGVV